MLLFVGAMLRALDRSIDCRSDLHVQALSGHRVAFRRRCRSHSRHYGSSSGIDWCRVDRRRGGCELAAYLKGAAVYGR
jgi:hypothetical protein